MFVFNSDPYELYKDRNKQRIGTLRNKIYSSYELRCINKRIDSWRIRYGIFLNFYIIYSILKFSILCLISILLYHEYKLMDNSSIDSSFSNFKEIFYNDSSTIVKIRDFIGDPIIESPNVAVFAYCSIIVGIYYGAYMLSNNYRKDPWQSSPITIFLNKHKEIFRIDRQISDLLNYAGNIIYKQEKNLSSKIIKMNNNNNSCHCQTDNRKSRKKSPIHLHIVLKMLTNSIDQMRPIIFCNKHNNERTFFSIRVISTFIFICVIPQSILPLNILFALGESRCELLVLKSWQTLGIFTLQEILTWLDIFINTLLISWSYAIQMMMTFESSRNQIKSIIDMQKKLQFDLDILRSGNSHFISIRDNQTTCNNCLFFKRKDSSLFTTTQKIELKVWSQNMDFFLLKDWIKFTVLDGEIKTTFKNLSQLLNVHLSMVGAGLFVALVGVEFETIEKYLQYRLFLTNCRMVFLTWLLIISNIILILCAYYQSKTFKLVKIVP